MKADIKKDDKGRKQGQHGRKGTTNPEKGRKRTKKDENKRSKKTKKKNEKRTKRDETGPKEARHLKDVGATEELRSRLRRHASRDHQIIRCSPSSPIHQAVVVLQ